MWGTALGIGPTALLMLAQFLYPFTPVFYGLYFVLVVPLAYAYVILQRRLVHLDLIINRTVVTFIVVLLTFAIATLPLILFAATFDLPADLVPLGGALATLAALLYPGLYRSVQRRVNRVLYGSFYDFATVTSDFARRLAQVTDRETLVSFMTQELPRQMGIRQAALLLAEEGELRLQDGDEPCALNGDDALCQALLAARRPLFAQHVGAPLASGRFAWAQLFAPLVFEEQLRGALVLGARTSGDVYSDQDVQILTTVAQQAALAYANVQLVEALRGLNRQLVYADEAHRKTVARDLHDTVLQQLFFIKQGLFRDQEHSQAVTLLEDAIQTLRSAIRNERPPLLDQGLQLALQGLVEETRQIVGAAPAIVWRNDAAGPLGFGDEQATALYRIAQEALANAIKHAGARTVTLTLESVGEAIRLCIADDGAGMPAAAAGAPGLHYGLVGIRERAAMIHAQLHVASTPGGGTRITVEVGTR
jgi:signal transduction histidine kinase